MWQEYEKEDGIYGKADTAGEAYESGNCFVLQ